MGQILFLEVNKLWMISKGGEAMPQKSRCLQNLKPLVERLVLPRDVGDGAKAVSGSFAQIEPVLPLA